MGFRYRRSIGLGGGVRLNVSKRGFSSVSIGRPGSTLNLGRRGVRATVGLPGTGLSYTTGGGSGGAGALALIGLVGSVLSLAFLLLGAAARGNRAAQLTVVVLAVGALFAGLRAPDADRIAPASASVPARSTVLAASPPAVAASPVASAYVPPVALATASIAATMRTTTGANVRSGPSAQAKAVGQLPAGALVEIIQGEGRWVKVRVDGSGTTGWVAWSLLTSP